MAVSSRGQDTWFSATGPGFESPYRYQKIALRLFQRLSARTQLCLQTDTFDFWPETEWSGEDFPEQSTTIFDAGCRRASTSWLRYWWLPSAESRSNVDPSSRGRLWQRAAAVR